MARMFYYIVDRLNEEKATLLAKSLRIIPDVKSVSVSAARGMVEIEAKRDMEQQVRLACDVAGATFRARAKM